MVPIVKVYLEGGSIVIVDGVKDYKASPDKLVPAYKNYSSGNYEDRVSLYIAGNNQIGFIDRYPDMIRDENGARIAVGVQTMDDVREYFDFLGIGKPAEGSGGVPTDVFSKEESQQLFVAKEDGKQLTDENYTLIEKTAVQNLPAFLSRDLTFESLVYTSLMNISFDVLRPNKTIPLGGNLTLNILNTQDGDSGIIVIKRGVAGNEVINLGGSIYNTLPTGSNALFLLSYVNQGGNIIWSA